MVIHNNNNDSKKMQDLNKKKAIEKVKQEFVKVEMFILKDNLKRFYSIMDDAPVTFKGLKEVEE